MNQKRADSKITLTEFSFFLKKKKKKKERKEKEKGLNGWTIQYIIDAADQ